MEILKTNGADVKVWTPLAGVESQALDQLRSVASLPWVFRHIAVMPDVHLGKGATVGSVIAMKDAISPATVGVDIGCGMAAVLTSLHASDLPDNLEALRAGFESAIPVGFNSHEAPVFNGVESLRRFGEKLFGSFKDLTPAVQRVESRAHNQVGTLGGGNHFIELCLDQGRTTLSGVEEEPRVWLVLHSGSRNIGNEIAKYHINVAMHLTHNQALPDRDLAVFLAGTPEMKAYRHDLFWAQEYARFNRLVMLDRCKDVIQEHLHPQGSPSAPYGFAPPILCHHNYVAEEQHFGEQVLVTRKGAIRAGVGDLGIIPGSMGTKSYIVRGLGNPESYCSASHGAGRRMSRTKATKTFTLADVQTQTAGVCCRKDAGIIDELPLAYKDIDEVMANQADLVEIVATLKQFLCVKG